MPEIELFNNDTLEFTYVKGMTIVLEHSLVSISKWESSWEKPFISNDPMTSEEVLDYVKCMTITQNVPDVLYTALTGKQFDEIEEYINKPMTATTFYKEEGSPERGRAKRTRVITNEVIYHNMIQYGIPMECQKWHLNRLLTLMEVARIAREPAKKLSRGEIAERNRRMNRMRREQMKTKG